MEDFHDSFDWPAGKLVAQVPEEAGYAGDGFAGTCLIDTPGMEIRVLKVKAGEETPYEQAGQDISLFVLEGTGVLALGYEDLELEKSTVAVVPRGILWGIKNTGHAPMAVVETMVKPT